MGKRDYHDALGAAKDARQEDTKNAYRKSTGHYQPDKNKANQILSLPLSFPLAAMGCQKHIFPLDGSIAVTIPPVTQNGNNLHRPTRRKSSLNDELAELLIAPVISISLSIAREEERILNEFQKASKEKPCIRISNNTMFTKTYHAFA